MLVPPGALERFFAALWVDPRSLTIDGRIKPFDFRNGAAENPAQPPVQSVRRVGLLLEFERMTVKASQAAFFPRAESHRSLYIYL
jgi:hypothetical protein